MAKKSAQKIKESSFVPDAVVAVARGGVVPGRLFCDSLFLKEYYSVKVDHWGLTATKDGSARLTQKLSADIKGKKILLVDDITDTGDSISLAKKHLMEMQPQEIKTATLIHLKGSKFVPDFFGEDRDWSWIVFPWNYMEDMVNLTRKIENYESFSAEALGKEFKQRYDLQVKAEQLREVLNQLLYLKKVKK